MRLERITIKPDVCGGEPTIRGIRITVSHVVELLAGGMTPGLQTSHHREIGFDR